MTTAITRSVRTRMCIINRRTGPGRIYTADPFTRRGGISSWTSSWTSTLCATSSAHGHHFCVVDGRSNKIGTSDNFRLRVISLSCPVEAARVRSSSLFYFLLFSSSLSTYLPSPPLFLLLLTSQLLVSVYRWPPTVLYTLPGRHEKMTIIISKSLQILTQKVYLAFCGGSVTSASFSLRVPADRVADCIRLEFAANMRASIRTSTYMRVLKSVTIIIASDNGYNCKRERK